MKTLQFYTRTLLLFALVLGFVHPSTAQHSWLSEYVELSDIEVVRYGGNVYGGGDVWVNFEAQVHRRFCRSCELIVVPVIYNSVLQQELTPLVVIPRRKLVMNQRQGVSMELYLSSVLARPGATVQYRRSVEYQDWMNGAAIRFDRYAECCTTAQTLPSEVVEHSLGLAATKIAPVYAFATPDTIRKARVVSKTGTAKIDFKVGKFQLDPMLFANKTELQKIDEIMHNQHDILEVKLWGTASPEGSYQLNAKLAQQRAQIISDYITQKYEVRPPQITITTTPENWQGLAQIVLMSDLPNKSEILGVVNSNQNPEHKDAEMKKLPNYNTLLREYYPQLRVVDFNVKYRTHRPSDQTLRTMYYENPGQLTHHELHTLAIHTPEQQHRVMLHCAEKFPDSPVANINAAVVELKNGNINAAQIFLRTAAHTLDSKGVSEPNDVWAVYYNTAGILQLEKGDIHGAVTLLKMARKLGLEAAAQNLEKLAIK